MIVVGGHAVIGPDPFEGFARDLDHEAVARTLRASSWLRIGLSEADLDARLLV